MFLSDSQPTVAPDDARTLQDAWNYGKVVRELKSSGISSIIWGAVSLTFFGGLLLSGDPFAIVAGAVAVALILEGVWVLVAPTPKALIIDAVILGLLGVSNLTLAALDLRADGRPDYFWFVIGGVQVLSVFGTLKKYGQIKHLVDLPPPKEWLDHAKAMVDGANRAAPATRPDVLSLQPAGKDRVVLGETALFVLVVQQIVFAGRSGVTAEVTPEPDAQGRVGVTISFITGSQKPYKARMTSEDAELLQRWIRGDLDMAGLQAQQVASVDPGVVGYVHSARQQGLTNGQIRDALRGSGWSEDEIEAGLRG